MTTHRFSRRGALGHPIVRAGASAVGGGGGATFRGNEPAGFTQATLNDWNSLAAPGWHDNSFTDPTWGPSARIITDATAPQSPSNVLQMQYQPNMTDSESSRAYQYWLGGLSARRLYVCLNVRLHANFIGHPTGTNKFFFPNPNGTNNCYCAFMGTGTGSFEPVVNSQGATNPGVYNGGATDGQSVTTQDSHCNLDPTFRLVRGQWYLWEVLLVGNTAGNADGTTDLWIDGSHKQSIRGQQLGGTGAALFGAQVNFDPVWGGNGFGTCAGVAHDTYGVGDGSTYQWDLRLDAVYISSKAA